jgi:hypothetical protein
MIGRIRGSVLRSSWFQKIVFRCYLRRMLFQMLVWVCSALRGEENKLCKTLYCTLIFMHDLCITEIWVNWRNVLSFYTSFLWISLRGNQGRFTTRPPGPSVQASHPSFTPQVHRHDTSSLTFTSPSATVSMLHTCTTQAKRHVAHKAFAKVGLVTTQPTSWITLTITHHKNEHTRVLVNVVFAISPWMSALSTPIHEQLEQQKKKNRKTRSSTK